MELKNIQTNHLAKVFSIQKTIRQREKKKLPTDQLNQKLAQLAERSIVKTLAIRECFEQLSFPAELPITAEVDSIKQLLGEHQVIIVAGETGCGKTTQLPKICLQAGYGARGLIAHTQPRRVAATSVAKRIADEMESPIGESVGYSIRFNNKVSDKTRLKLMTDGVLLTEIESDPLLSKYEVIIIDEAHERSLNIDFLLGFLKQILAKRRELKLIITSATIDPERFSRAFNDAPILTVEGRSYPVNVKYRPALDDDSAELDSLLDRVSSAVDECIQESTGNILIFADGEGQIKTIIKHLQGQNYPATEILPLYARLGIGEQQKIFSLSNKRKIIVSTNVAETSLTVPGIIFVIDIGTARISRFSQRSKIQQLPVEKISRASADQRKGRCGRIAPGTCIRLYSEEDYLQRDEFTCAEIKRTNLSAVVLRLKLMKVKSIEDFPFIEPPSDRAWKVALNSLYELGAINHAQSITPIGLSMARLPVDPQLARILVQPKLAAVDEMLIFCALMSVREVRERPHDKQQKADQLHKAYQQKDSDVLTAIFLWRKLQDTKNGLSSNAFKQWCSKNLINFLGWLEWRKVYFQLKEAVEGLGIKVNQSPAHDDDCLRALVPGFISHIFCKTPEPYFQGVRGLKVWVHPSSLLFKKNKSWLLSAEMIETEKLYARMNCQIEPKWIEESAPHLLKSNYQDIHWRKKNGQVMAYLSQTLLGLPVVNKRLINYASIDSAKSRDLFLKEALAGDQLNEDFPFLRANRDKIKQLIEQEQRQRLNNICLDSDALAALYDEVLPPHINSFPSLKKWLKRDFKPRNKLLSFSLKQLTQNKNESLESYPSVLKIKGFEFPLSYCFAPGTDEDGVSIEIPANMLNQFSDRDFDWLVPGYLEEKILATIKTLPKAMRRELIPLNETAKNCTSELIKIEQTNKRFIDELARVLQRQTGKLIKIDDFTMNEVSSHLSMKFRVKNNRSEQYFMSLSQAKTASVTKQVATQKKGGITHYRNWQFDDFVIERELATGGTNSRIFQGLKDCGKHVVIATFPSLETAIISHHQGMARLILLDNESQLNKFLKTWPEYKLFEKLSIRFNGFKEVFDCLAIRWAVSLIKEEKHLPVYTQVDFANSAALFTKNFRVVLAEQLNQLLPLIKQREQILVQISELSELAFKDSIDDLKQQMKLLWSPKILLTSGNGLFEDYHRHQEGISVRLKRIRTNYPKEKSALETWEDWREWWDDLLSIYAQHSQKIKDAEFDDLFWALQEFRISLFSPGVQVKGGISAKKLQKRFEALESSLAG